MNTRLAQAGGDSPAETALRDLLAAILYKGPPVNFAAQGEAANFCYEARVPVDIVIRAEEALGISRMACGSEVMPGQRAPVDPVHVAIAAAAHSDDKRMGAAPFISDG